MKRRAAVVYGGIGRGEHVSPLVLGRRRVSRQSQPTSVRCRSCPPTPRKRPGPKTLSRGKVAPSKRHTAYTSLEITVKTFPVRTGILPTESRGRMPRRGRHTPASEDGRIGSRIKDARVNRGVQQKALAAQLGMAQSVLSRYERGVLRLPSSLLARIASALKVSTDEILSLKESKSGVVVRDRRFLSASSRSTRSRNGKRTRCSRRSTAYFETQRQAEPSLRRRVSASVSPRGTRVKGGAAAAQRACPLTRASTATSSRRDDEGAEQNQQVNEERRRLPQSNRVSPNASVSRGSRRVTHGALQHPLRGDVSPHTPGADRRRRPPRHHDRHPRPPAARPGRPESQRRDARTADGPTCPPTSSLRGSHS